jgi:hypothetical protein
MLIKCAFVGQKTLIYTEEIVLVNIYTVLPENLLNTNFGAKMYVVIVLLPSQYSWSLFWNFLFFMYVFIT